MHERIHILELIIEDMLQSIIAVQVLQLWYVLLAREQFISCVLLTALPTATCMHNGNIRLVGGEISYEGRVEICLSNSWVSVCDSDWNVLDSAVVCRQLTGIQNPCKPSRPLLHESLTPEM